MQPGVRHGLHHRNPGNGSDQFAYGPVAVCAISPTRAKSFGFAGDSIGVGTGDTTIKGLYEYGFLVRALNWQYLYVHVGANGESGTNWGEAGSIDIGRNRYRGALFGAVDVVVQEHSTSGFGNNSKTVAQVQTALISSRYQIAARGPRVYQTTCTPAPHPPTRGRPPPTRRR